MERDQDLTPEGVAIFDLYRIRLGCLQMHGSGHRYVFPYARMREAMAEAEKCAIALGAMAMIVRLHNRCE